MTSTLHLYKNDAIDWFAAESAEHATALARTYYIDVCQCDPDEIEVDLSFDQVPDDKVLGLREGAEHVGRKSALEWARENGPGHWATTND